MKNRITVVMNGQEYTLVTNEDEALVKKIADYVNAKIDEILESSRLSRTDAAVLAAVNIAEEYFRAVDTAENLRNQLKDYLEDASRAKSELSELRRELSKLRKL